MKTFGIQNVADPINPQDVASKNYVDTAGGGGGTDLSLAYLDVSEGATIKSLVALDPMTIKYSNYGTGDANPTLNFETASNPIA